jgi:hypothetical protein
MKIIIKININVTHWKGIIMVIVMLIEKIMIKKIRITSLKFYKSRLKIKIKIKNNIIKLII